MINGSSGETDFFPSRARSPGCVQTDLRHTCNKQLLLSVSTAEASAFANKTIKAHSCPRIHEQNSMHKSCLP